MLSYCSDGATPPTLRFDESGICFTSYVLTRPTSAVAWQQSTSSLQACWDAPGYTDDESGIGRFDWQVLRIDPFAVWDSGVVTAGASNRSVGGEGVRISLPA